MSAGAAFCKGIVMAGCCKIMVSVDVPERAAPDGALGK